ncbi:MAG: hypothetical protein MK193_06360 [Lentisphaeria bacterium]|nr:hypothetical protein [Lentisphaeria bacterium]
MRRLKLVTLKNCISIILFLGTTFTVLASNKILFPPFPIDTKHEDTYLLGYQLYISRKSNIENDYESKLKKLGLTVHDIEKLMIYEENRANQIKRMNQDLINSQAKLKHIYLALYSFYENNKKYPKSLTELKKRYPDLDIKDRFNDLIFDYYLVKEDSVNSLQILASIKPNFVEWYVVRADGQVKKMSPLILLKFDKSGDFLKAMDASNEIQILYGKALNAFLEQGHLPSTKNELINKIYETSKPPIWIENIVYKPNSRFIIERKVGRYSVKIDINGKLSYWGLEPLVKKYNQSLK